MLINLTPHAINIITRKDGTKTINPSGITPRLTQITTDTGDCVEGVPILKRELGEIQDLPKEKKGTYYIVSSLIASACPDRSDLLVPRTIRDESGRIVGCDGFFS